MTDFYVDTQGMSSISALLRRAQDDTAQMESYVKQYCRLELTDRGIFLGLAVKHSSIVESINSTLKALENAQSQGVSEVDKARDAYTRTDNANLARLDATYAGAAHQQTVMDYRVSDSERYANPRRAAFADRSDPCQCLGTPNYATEFEQWSLNPISDLVSPCAWAREITILVFDFDPLENWVQEASGDWRAYELNSYAFRQLAQAAGDMATNLMRGVNDTFDVWRGNAAEAMQEWQLNLAAAAMALQDCCNKYSEQYEKAAEAAKEFFTAAGNLLSDFLDLLLAIQLAGAAGAATAETGIGAVVGFGAAAFYTWCAYDMYKTISSLYTNYENLYKGIGGIIDTIQAAQAAIKIPQVAPYDHPGC